MFYYYYWTLYVVYVHTCNIFWVPLYVVSLIFLCSAFMLQQFAFSSVSDILAICSVYFYCFQLWLINTVHIVCSRVYVMIRCLSVRLSVPAVDRWSSVWRVCCCGPGRWAGTSAGFWLGRVNALLPLEAKKIFENLTTKWCILKYIWIYVVSIAPFSTPACPDCSQNITYT